MKACTTKNKESNEKNMQANYLVTETISKLKEKLICPLRNPR
jgi:hypothetical protein